MDQTDLPDPIAVELECLRRRVVELENIITEKLGVESFHECHEDCQYPNIVKEMAEGALNQIYDETMIKEYSEEFLEEEEKRNESL